LQLVEQHIIKSNNPFFKECDNICFKSKNLYNSCLYNIRQEYINNKINIINNLYHIMKNTDEYKSLPRKVSSSVLLMVQKNFKSFFNSLKEYNKNLNKFKNRPHLPKYLDKIDGRYMVSYTNQAISKKIFKKVNKIKLSQSNIEFKTKINDFNIIDCIRIVPKIGYYVIEIVYTIKEKGLLNDNNQYLSIDIGLNNLATLTSNKINFDPIIINGKPLKNINQYYNKKRSDLQSILKIRNNKNNSNKLNLLTLKRKNKIDNYLHKASKNIINICNENNINTIIIGKNDNWKQDINIGKTNNQNFVNIPHSRFIEIIKYKCEISGIKFITIEESYTSKASFLDLDKIPNYSKNNKTNYNFNGKRISRGLYKTNKGIIINADVNGSYNILRKAIPKVFSNGVEGVRVHPKIIKILKG